MSMSTHVVGIVPPDEKWKEMKAIWDACENAGVSIPVEVDRFFNSETPDDKGVVIDLGGFGKKLLTEWRAVGCEGFELEIDKIPPDVKILRFYNSW